MSAHHFEDAKAHFQQGIAAFEAGQLAAAERHFEASLALLPGRVSTLTNLAATRIGLGRHAEALAVADEALAAEPACVDALWPRAVALSELHRPEDALLALAAVLAQDATHAGAWRLRSALLAAQGRDDAALEAFEAFLRLQPEDAEVWLRQGQSQVRLGRFDVARVSFERAVALAPTSALAWSNLGEVHKELGQRDAAVAAFQKALAAGGDADMLRYHLAALAAQETPSAAPARYVRTLFDGYAESFDAHLVEVLRYQAPGILARELQDIVGAQRLAQALDLGCGTGLCGPLLVPLATAIDGVDLAPRMLDMARTRGIYRHLVEADVVAYLYSTAIRYDLVVAADLFIYIGDLAPVFEGVTAATRHGGLFSFSVEFIDGDKPFELLPSMRYAHSEAHVRRLALRHGFEVLRSTRHPLRSEQGVDIPGLYLHLRKV